MKKSFLRENTALQRILALTLALCLLLSGCSSGSQQSAPEPAAEPEGSEGESLVEVAEGEVQSAPEYETLGKIAYVAYYDDEPVTLDFIPFEKTVQATDIKGSGYVYEETVDGVEMTANRLIHNIEDFWTVEKPQYEENTKYTLALMLLSALNEWDPNGSELFDAMADRLFRSSLEPDRDGHMLGVYADRFFVENGNDRTPWIGSFFAGADESNGYTPSDPLTLIMREDAYEPQHSVKDGIDIYIETVYVTIPGTEEEWKYTCYEDPSDGRWYLYGGYTSIFGDDI